jgi:hypothetical protein
LTDGHGSRIALAPLADEIRCGFGPGGEFELEAGVEETAGNDVAAFEQQFGFGAVKERGNLKKRRECG